MNGSAFSEIKFAKSTTSSLARGAKAICLLGGLSGAYPPYLDADVKRALVEAQADAVDGAIMMARRAQGLAERWS